MALNTPHSYTSNFKSLTVLLVFFLNLGLWSCSSSKKNQNPEELKNQLLEKLTDFSIAINEEKFEKAVNLLEPTEASQLKNTNGEISEESKKRLRALKLQRLITNKELKLIDGKIAGVLAMLPMVGSAPLDFDTEKAIDSLEKAPPDTGFETEKKINGPSTRN